MLPPAELLAESIRQAASLGAAPAAFADIKQNRIEPLAADIRSRLEEKLASFVDHWYAPTARQRLQEALAKFGPR